MAQFYKELTKLEVTQGNLVFQEVWRLYMNDLIILEIAHVSKFLTIVGAV